MKPRRGARASIAIMFLAEIMWLHTARAEEFQGIGALDTLADIKAKYPHANFERLNPAWAKEQDVVFGISGDGLNGQLIIKFYDHRPAMRRMLDAGSDVVSKESLTRLANESEDSVGVAWVRWAPANPIPMKRLKAKYGPPDTRGVSDWSFEPTASWRERGISATLSDDEKQAIILEYTFTNADYCSAWHSKHPELSKIDFDMLGYHCAPLAKKGRSHGLSTP